MDIYYFSAPGWFLLGLSLGLGPCMAHQLWITLPYIGMTRNKKGEGFLEVVYYSLGRIVAYTALASMAGLAGAVFYQLVTDGLITIVARLVLGVFLLAISVMLLLFEQNPVCHRLKSIFIKIPGRAMAFAGILTALTPCPALIGMMAYTAASGNVAYGATSGMFFALGTSISPLIIAGPLCGYLKEKLPYPRLITTIRHISGLLLFGYGLHILINVMINLNVFM